jgi:hypothetical protein
MRKWPTPERDKDCSTRWAVFTIVIVIVTVTVTV